MQKQRNMREKVEKKVTGKSEKDNSGGKTTTHFLLFIIGAKMSSSVGETTFLNPPRLAVWREGRKG